MKIKIRIKNLIEKVKANFKLIILVTTIVLLIVAIIINPNEETGQPQPQVPIVTTIDKNTYSWNDVTPGEDTSVTMEEKLEGMNLLSVSRDQNLTVYEYFNDKLTYKPTKVWVDSKQDVKFIKEYLPINEIGPLELFENRLNLKEPNIRKYDKEEPQHDAYVYLNQGIILNYNSFRNEVMAITYFEPTTEQDFLETWGNKLQDYYGENEGFYYN